MSSYRPLQPTLGSLLSPLLVLSSEPETPLFCLLCQVFESIPQLGPCDPKRLQELLCGCCSVASVYLFHWISECPACEHTTDSSVYHSFFFLMTASISSSQGTVNSIIITILVEVDQSISGHRDVVMISCENFSWWSRLALMFHSPLGDSRDHFFVLLL